MARVKICGLTRPQDVEAAREADALGFVVASPASRRNLPLERARELARGAAPFQATVAVTVATDETTLAHVLDVVRPHALQVPGTLARPVLRRLAASHPGVRILLSCRPEDVSPDLGGASAIVLDALAPDGYGGTGKTLAWHAVRALAPRIPVPVILAGGLTPSNVAEAIAAAGPHAVDVSSGVETDGLKDAQKIHEFIRNARHAGGAPS